MRLVVVALDATVRRAAPAEVNKCMLGARRAKRWMDRLHRFYSLKSKREVRCHRPRRRRDKMGDAGWMGEPSSTVVGLDFLDKGWSVVGSVS